MKRLILCITVAAVMTVMFTSCDKIKETVSAAKDATAGPSEIDYQFLSKPSEVKKWYDEVVQKAGSNAKIMDEVRFSISRPSKEGMIKREGEKDYLVVSVVYQDDKDKRMVQEINYFGHVGGWKPAERKEIQVMGIGAENFKLEDELFDFSQVTLDTVNKILTEALKKFKDDLKYEYQYISDLTIKKNGFDVAVKGKLKSNAQEKTEYYRTNLQGTPK